MAHAAGGAQMAAVGCTVVATSQRVQLGDISLEEGCSGWRNLDPERVTQLADEFRAGNLGSGPSSAGALAQEL